MIFLVNNFYLNCKKGHVSWDEEINFPPSSKYSSTHCQHPVLKNLNLQGILEALKTQSTTKEEFEPYLAWMTSMLLTMGWTIQPSSLNFMKVPCKTSGAKNKKKKSKKAATTTEPEVEVD